MEKTMCRIDAPFGNITFDEKTDPEERFVQALDEFEIQGNLRTLLIKHFSKSWKRVFGDFSNLEKILNNIKQHDSEKEKCVGFLVLLFKKDIINEDLAFYLRTQTNKESVLMDFLRDVIQVYYPNSPFSLFQDGMENIVNSYFVFVSWAYGKDFCFSKEFFDDKSLNSLNKHERTRVLWCYFKAIAHQFESLGETRLIKEFTSIASLSFIAGPLTKNSLEIIRGFDFVKAWIKFDSQAGRLSYSWIDFSYDYNSPLQKIRDLIRSEHGTSEKNAKLLNSWFNEAEREFQKLLYLNADLSHASVSDVDQWASELNSYLNLINKDFSYNELTTEEFDARKDNELSELCSELTTSQVNHWIKWSINKDFQSVLNSKQQGSIYAFSESKDKWIQKEYFKSWKDTFLEGFNVLQVEDQLSILSCSVPYTEECYLGYFD